MIIEVETFSLVLSMLNFGPIDAPQDNYIQRQIFHELRVDLAETFTLTVEN